jgi:hypothetical protein
MGWSKTVMALFGSGSPWLIHPLRPVDWPTVDALQQLVDQGCGQLEMWLRW